MDYPVPLSNPGPGGSYRDRDIVNGIKGSAVPAAAIEAPNREIFNVLVAAGIDPSAADLTQLTQAITKLSPLPSGFVSERSLAVGAGDPDADVVVQSLSCRSDDDDVNIRLIGPQTVQLSAEGILGIDVGAVEASTWYFLWVIAKSDGAGATLIFSKSRTAPSLPVDYAKKRLIWAVQTDTGAVLRPFIQNGDWCEWQSPPLDLDVSVIGTAARDLFPITVPPGVPLKAMVRAYVNDGGSPQLLLLSSPLQPDVAPSQVASPLAHTYDNANGITLNDICLIADDQARLGVRADVAAIVFRLATVGFEFHP